MQLLVDESAGKRLATFLASIGHDVLFVGDVMPSAPDQEVIARAEAEERVLISDDKDFGEFAFRLRRPTSGIILVRVADKASDIKFNSVVGVLDKLDARGKFIIIKKGRFRVRKL